MHCGGPVRLRLGGFRFQAKKRQPDRSRGMSGARLFTRVRARSRERTRRKPAQAIGGARGGAAQGRWLRLTTVVRQANDASNEVSGQSMTTATRRTPSSEASSWSAPRLTIASGTSVPRFLCAKGEAAAPRVRGAAVASWPAVPLAGVPKRNARAKNAGRKYEQARRNMALPRAASVGGPPDSYKRERRSHARRAT